MKISYKLSVILTACLLCAGILLGINADASAQSTDTIIEVKVQQTILEFKTQFSELFDPDTGILKGPFDIIVGTTDKGAGGIKYSNVPYVFMLNNGIVVFPNGDNGKRGKSVLVLTTNATIRTK